MPLTARRGCDCGWIFIETIENKRLRFSSVLGSRFSTFSRTFKVVAKFIAHQVSIAYFEGFELHSWEAISHSRFRILTFRMSHVILYFDLSCLMCSGDDIPAC